MPNSVPISTPTPPPPSPLPHSRLARSHNRRFHVRFPGVDSEEHLLNYYSCALVADILLQGHLYITENYFAFYSNIFGRKTQILLPVSDVIKVTKERTAKIIPNAVGLYTVEGKYVFGSLLSRNTTYRLMHHVWLKSADPDTTEDEPSASEASEPGTSDEAVIPPVVPPPLVVRGGPEEAVVRRLSRRQSDLFPRISAQAAARRQATASRPTTPDGPIVQQITLSKCGWECAKGRECYTRIEENVQTMNSNSLPRSTLVLLAATLFFSALNCLSALDESDLLLNHGFPMKQWWTNKLVMLFLLATVLVYRVSLVHTKSSVEESWPMKSGHRLTSYLELLKQQQEAVEEEIMRITATLKSRLSDLGQVKESIDQLSEFTKRPLCSEIKENSEE